jgi:hypothetical protein
MRHPRGSEGESRLEKPQDRRAGPALRGSCHGRPGHDGARWRGHPASRSRSPSSLTSIPPIAEAGERKPPVRWRRPSAKRSARLALQPCGSSGAALPAGVRLSPRAPRDFPVGCAETLASQKCRRTGERVLRYGAGKKCGAVWDHGRAGGQYIAFGPNSAVCQNFSSYR